MAKHYCTKERYLQISETYNKYGEVKTAELLGITIESLKRRIREAKELDIYVQSANNTQSKYLNKILETYSEAELKIIAEGKTQILEKSKKLNINFDGNRVRIGDDRHSHRAPEVLRTTSVRSVRRVQERESGFRMSCR